MKIALKEFTMNYLKQGQGPALILLHGNGEDAHIFEEAMDVLKAHFTVYALDSRGHGKSKAKVCQFHYQTMADDLLEFVEKMNLTKFYCYGFSDGAIVALLFAIKHSHRIEKMMISGANLSPDALFSDCLQTIKKNYLHASSEREKKLCQLMLEEPNISPEELKKITCPTFVLAGENDIVPVEHTILISQSIPSSQLKILSNENHDSYITHCKKIAYEILKAFGSFQNNIG